MNDPVRTPSLLLLSLLSLTGLQAPAQEAKHLLLKPDALVTNDHVRAFFASGLFNYYSNTGCGGYNSWNGNGALEYPVGQGETVLYEAGLYWGGYHMGRATPKVGGSEYRRGLQAGRIITPGTSVPPGTLVPNCMSDDPSAAKYRLYRVRPDVRPGISYNVVQSELEEEASLISRYEPGTTAASLYSQYLQDANDWPAKGSQSDPEGLAPFTDQNGNGVYDPSIDIPGQPGAAQTLYYVANDNDQVRTQNMAGSPPIGIEMHRTIWAYTGRGLPENVIFSSSVLINKGGYPVDSMIVGEWADPDIGDAGTDYAGCDTTLDMGYAYNSARSDATYGYDAPAYGIVLLSGPAVPGGPADSAIISLRYRKGMKNLRISSFAIHTGSTLEYADPASGEGGDAQRYCLLRGRTRSCAPIIDETTGEQTVFPFAGDPVRGTGNTMERYEDDRDWRFLVSSGPFTFASGDTQEIVSAQIVARGPDRLGSVAALQEKALQVHRAYRDLLSPRPDVRAEVRYPDGATAEVRLGVNLVELSGSGVKGILRRGDGSVAATVLLYDDGLHTDGAAQDRNFGGSARIPVEHLPLSLDCEVTDLLGSAKVYASASENLTVAGPLSAADLRIFSDNLNDDGAADMYENVRYGFTLRNGTPFTLTGLRFNALGSPTREIPAFAPGSEFAFQYDPANSGSYFSLDVPWNAGTPILIIPISGWDQEGNAWVDTLELPIVPLRYPPRVSRATHMTGWADGDLGVMVNDPRAVKNHRYRIFASESQTAGSPPTFTLEDSTEGRIILSGQPFPDDYGHNVPLTDGFKIVRGEAVVPGTGYVYYGGGSPIWTTSGGAGGLGLEAYSGAIGSGVRSWPSGGTAYDRLRDVEIRFVATDTLGVVTNPADANISFAYRYLAAADAPTAQPAFAPYIIRRGSGYPFQDFVRNLPFAAFDVNATPTRRLAVGYLENNVPSGLVNGRYWPPVGAAANPPASNNVDSLGPREWFFIFDVSYGETPDPALQVDIRNTHTRLMWFGTPARRAVASSAATAEIYVGNTPTTGDVWSFNPVDILGGVDKTIPDQVELFPNYPNPFNAGTTIKYGLPADSRVTLRIYNLLGQEVRKLVDENQLEGYRTAKWDGRNSSGMPVASGVYLYRLQATTLDASAREFTSAQKMIVLR